jgi:hypothetical protein
VVFADGRVLAAHAVPPRDTSKAYLVSARTRGGQLSRMGAPCRSHSTLAASSAPRCPLAAVTHPRAPVTKTEQIEVSLFIWHRAPLVTRPKLDPRCTQRTWSPLPENSVLPMPRFVFGRGDSTAIFFDTQAARHRRIDGPLANGSGRASRIMRGIRSGYARRPAKAASRDPRSGPRTSLAKRNRRPRTFRERRS